MKKTIGYISNSFEIISLELIQEIEKARDDYQVIGVGVHSDDYFYELYGRMPIKPYTDRVKLAKSLKRIDFVFELNSDSNSDAELIVTKDTSVKNDTVKKYHIAYAPGTYDLFHEGHLEHLIEVKSLCDILVAGVNSDNLVYQNKSKRTKMSEKDRCDVVKNLKFVDYVYLVTTNDKSVANKWVKTTIGSPIDVIFLGSDLKEQDFCNSEGIPVLFTERDPVLMKKRSSTYYRKVLNELKKED